MYSGDSGGGVVVFSGSRIRCVCFFFQLVSLVFACIAMSNILKKHKFVAIFVCKSAGCNYLLLLVLCMLGFVWSM